MKKIILTLTLSLLFCLTLALAVSARDVYLEKIPEELKVTNDAFTHFVVFEEEKYYTGSGNTINGFNTTQMDDDMASAGIDSAKIGTEYLTRFNVPSHMGGTLVTYVNLNAMKGHTYFKHKCGYLQLAGTVNKIHDMNECTNQLRCIDFGEDSQVKEIPYCFCPSSTNLKSVKNFPRDLNIIQGHAFNKCYTAFTGELYLNATTIGESAFNNSISHVTGLVLGPKVKNIQNQSLCVRLSEIGARPADGLVQITYIEFQCDVSQVNFATQGNDKGSFYFIGGNPRSPYSKLECIILSHPDNAKGITEGSVFNHFTAEGITILFNDSDGLDDYVTASHSYVDSGIVYESFLEKGSKQVACTKCGNVKGEEAPAIFACLGYSVMTFGTDPAFTLGYSLDTDALSAYEAATGNTISYGILMTSKANLGANNPLDEKGEVITLDKGSIYKAELNRATSYFDGIVKGFKTQEQMDTEIIICAYAIVRDAQDNITLIDYLGEKAQDGSLAGVSYNELNK